MRLLGTDVCVEILRGNRQVIERRRWVADTVTTTWITAAELSYGAAKSRSPEKNLERVQRFLGSLTVHGLDLPASHYFGRIKAHLEREGRRLADADLLIASVTLARGAVLVTGNLRHYGRIPDLRIEDWIRDGVADQVHEDPSPYRVWGEPL